MKKINISILVLGICFSCTNDDLHPLVSANDSFEIKLDEKVIIGDTLTLKCIQIEDKRCLQEKCSSCFGTSAKIWLTLLKDNHVDTMKLQIVGCNLGYDDCETCENVNFEIINGLKFGLLKLAPYPTISNSPIPKSVYKATLKVLTE